MHRGVLSHGATIEQSFGESHAFLSHYASAQREGDSTQGSTDLLERTAFAWNSGSFLSRDRS